MITADQVKADPSVAGASDAVVQAWIDQAYAWALDPAFYGDDLDTAALYWVRHNLVSTKGARVGAAGAVAGMSAGGVSVQFAQVGAATRQADWSTTAWGRLLEGMTRRLAQGVDLVF